MSARCSIAESTQMSTCLVSQERKAFRESHPVGFVAAPQRKSDGSVDLFTWKCEIPGKPGVRSLCDTSFKYL